MLNIAVNQSVQAFQDEEQGLFLGLQIKSNIKVKQNGHSNQIEKNCYDFSDLCSHNSKITQAYLQAQLQQLEKQTFQMEQYYISKIKGIRQKLSQEELIQKQLGKQMAGLKICLHEYSQDTQHTRRILREQVEKGQVSTRKRTLWKVRKRDLNGNLNVQEEKPSKGSGSKRLNRIIQRIKEKSKSSRSKSPVHLKIFSKQKTRHEQKVNSHYTYYEDGQTLNYLNLPEKSQNDYDFPSVRLRNSPQNFNPNLLRQVKSEKNLLLKPIPTLISQPRNTPPYTPITSNRLKNQNEPKTIKGFEYFCNFPNPPESKQGYQYSKQKQRKVQQGKQAAGTIIGMGNKKASHKNINILKNEKSQRNFEIRKSPTVKDIKPRWK